jgi:Icc-related predicted phosphoesterase
MRVQFIADFHTEFFNFNKFDKLMEAYLPPHPMDSKTVLCCSGDMGTYAHYPSTYKPFFAHVSKRFKAVIVVPGNHSWYNTAGVWGNEKEFWKDKKIPGNIFYLDNEVKLIQDVLFVGSCLWTSFNDLNPISMMVAQRGMSDFNCIKVRNYEVSGVYGTLINSGKLTPECSVVRHYESVQFIKDCFRAYNDKKVVVITHHLPSEQSVDPNYKGDSLNPAYYTSLDTLIMHHQPAVWAHGHTHGSQDYMIDNTRVICNPLGYHGSHINKKFNKNLVMEI